MDIVERLKSQIEGHNIVVYIKGSPQFPQCGFSARTVEALKGCDVDFAYIDVLSDPEVRQNLPAYSDWPTFPQLFVSSELVGGCDIICELFETGELKPMLQAAVANSGEAAS